MALKQHDRKCPVFDRSTYLLMNCARLFQRKVKTTRNSSTLAMSVNKLNRDHSSNRYSSVIPANTPPVFAGSLHSKRASTATKKTRLSEAADSSLARLARKAKLTIVVHRKRHALTLSNLRHGVLMRRLGLTDANEGSHKCRGDPLDGFARSGCLNLRNNGCATKLWIDLRKHGTASVDFRPEGERLAFLQYIRRQHSDRSTIFFTI